MNNWKKAGLIGLGAVLGVLLSLNFSVIAQRETKLPIPYEDLQLLSAVFGRIKSDYVEPVSDQKLIKEAINDGADSTTLIFSTPKIQDLQIDPGQVRRPRHRSASRTARSRSVSSMTRLRLTGHQSATHHQVVTAQQQQCHHKGRRADARQTGTSKSR
jgi:hypothetical protein